MLRSEKGNEVANHYGSYYELKDINKLQSGIVLDILCNDGLHYHVELKEYDKQTGNGKLHFCKWSKKYDYTGQLKDLYLAEKDKYSKINNLSDKNNYADIQSGSPSNINQPKRKEKPRTKFPTETKYPEDFLGPPKNSTTSRKRTSLNNNNNNNEYDDNDNDNEDDDIEKVAIVTVDEVVVSNETTNQNNKNVTTALVQFAGVNESRTGRTIKRSHHFDEVQTSTSHKPKKRKGPQPKVDEVVTEDSSNKRKKVANANTLAALTDSPNIPITMTQEEIEKKKREIIINTFVTSCSTATNTRELTKAINTLNNGRDIFTSLGLNVDQLMSLLAARKSIDQTLTRLLEHKIRLS